MPVVIKYFLSFSRSQKYATRSLRSLLAYFYDLSNSRKYLIHHWHNIILFDKCETLVLSSRHFVEFHKSSFASSRGTDTIVDTTQFTQLTESAPEKICYDAR